MEFKHFLSRRFNHSFDNLHSIVCWDTQLKHDDTLTDIADTQRKLVILQPGERGDYTRYYLENPKKALRIEVFVLKHYLREKIGVDFRPRPATALA